MVQMSPGLMSQLANITVPVEPCFSSVQHDSHRVLESDTHFPSSTTTPATCEVTALSVATAAAYTQSPAVRD